MKSLYLVLVFIIALGCASSSNNEENQKYYPNLIKPNPPEEQPSQSSKVYIDSVKKITPEELEQPALLISGNLADACTHLEDISHQIQNDSLKIKISAWRNPEQMCAQALTPFSVVYDELTEKEISDHSKLFINDSAYSY